MKKYFGVLQVLPDPKNANISILRAFVAKLLRKCHTRTLYVITRNFQHKSRTFWSIRYTIWHYMMAIEQARCLKLCNIPKKIFQLSQYLNKNKEMGLISRHKRLSTSRHSIEVKIKRSQSTARVRQRLACRSALQNARGPPPPARRDAAAPSTTCAQRTGQRAGRPARHASERAPSLLPVRGRAELC